MVEVFFKHVVKYGNQLKLVREWQLTHFSNMKHRRVERPQDCRRGLLSVV